MKTQTKKSPTKKASTGVKTSPKKAPVTKKTTPIKKEASSKIHTVSASTSVKTGPKEGVKMLGILHLAGNLLSGGTLGIVLVLIYLFVRKDQISQLERETCYEIINFNLSFIIYVFVASILVMILIGLLILPIVLIAWFVLMIVGFLRHIEGQNYKYPFIIRFLS